MERGLGNNLSSERFSPTGHAGSKARACRLEQKTARCKDPASGCLGVCTIYEKPFDVSRLKRVVGSFSKGEGYCRSLPRCSSDLGYIIPPQYVHFMKELGKEAERNRKGFSHQPVNSMSITAISAFVPTLINGPYTPTPEVTREYILSFFIIPYGFSHLSLTGIVSGKSCPS